MGFFCVACARGGGGAFGVVRKAIEFPCTTGVVIAFYDEGGDTPAFCFNIAAIFDRPEI